MIFPAAWTGLDSGDDAILYKACTGFESEKEDADDDEERKPE